jgi:hypothetical protein
MADRNKDELVRFLEERAFKPVLNAGPKGRSEAEQKKTRARPKGHARRDRALSQMPLGAGSCDEFQARPRFGAGQTHPRRTAFAGSADDK